MFRFIGFSALLIGFQGFAGGKALDDDAGSLDGSFTVVTVTSHDSSSEESHAQDLLRRHQTAFLARDFLWANQYASQLVGHYDEINDYITQYPFYNARADFY